MTCVVVSAAQGAFVTVDAETQGLRHSEAAGRGIPRSGAGQCVVVTKVEPTVGFPRESSISRPITSTISRYVFIRFFPFGFLEYGMGMYICMDRDGGERCRYPSAAYQGIASSQSPLGSASALRRKLLSLPCSSFSDAIRFAGFASETGESSRG